ncbi:MAG: branched-chain amino acid ABC transporter permease [Limnochordaceae bacterium]|uniref:Branched-chain amino acid ABC transporter permease n=1 Tax=Carboxydichorda subterranea TaxID=3109565 RepID=A0ABZ1BYC5_9FIRM|nr:branched-chain amino acid ABC transporter permease [Limnochorda sp. L945t]MBE3598928.1 branched-chain amino acid ABC transporter permease [Limnochordaceae bacterium]WRP17816.1 branched-chain amino acid ABC transporter permease [Limnochorda sp. L945t]
MAFYIAQQIVNALQLGSVYALIALGYSMVYGVLRLINFAHGDIFMVGAFLGFFAAAVLRWPFVATLLFSMVATAALGVTIERLAYRPLRDAPRVSAVITALGIGLFLEHFTLATVGAQPRQIPRMIPMHFYTLPGDIGFSSTQAVILAVALVLMLALDLFVNRTLMGMAMRAISWDIRHLPLMGVPVNRVISLTFAIGSALAAAGGILVGLAYPIIDPYMGILVGWKAFVAAVVGGIGSIRGAMLGGYILAATEVLVAAFLPSTYRDFVAFSLLLLLLVFKPTGLMGRVWAQKV